VIFSFSRYAGFAVAFVASAIASTPYAAAQEGSHSALAVFSPALHASVTGVIRDRDGNPQIGTAVELLNSSYAVIAHTFTDDRGRYRLPSLAAGVYQLRASSELYLPAIKPNLHLVANSRAIVNLTLSTLYEAMQWFPAERRTPESAADDWDWTLRLSANRPLLRFLDPAQTVALQQAMAMQQLAMQAEREARQQQIEIAFGPGADAGADAEPDAEPDAESRQANDAASSGSRSNSPYDDERSVTGGGERDGELDGEQDVLLRGGGAAIAGAGQRHESDNGLRAQRFAIRSGFDRFGQGGLQQQIVYSTGDTATRAFLLEAQSALATSGATPRLSTTAAYKQALSPDRSMTTVMTVTSRPDIASGTSAGSGSGLTTMHIRSGSTLRLGDFAEISAGTDLVAAHAGNTAVLVGGHPFGSLAAHIGGPGTTVVSYRVATSPGMASADRLESAAALDTPGLSEVNGALRMQEGLHQELRMEHAFTSHTTLGAFSTEVSIFHDSLSHPVVQGLLDKAPGSAGTGEVLYDPTTGLIAVSGESYTGGGVLAMLHDQLSPDTWISLRAALSQAAQLGAPSDTPAGASAAQPQTFGAPNFATQPTPMLAVSAATRLAATGTVVRGGYRWQPYSSLTQVAPFSDPMPDAYLSFSLRQPLHLEKVGTGKIEAIVDVQNLLAQGYRPFLSRDGSTVYFAQAQRCIAGGIAFSF
jgi:hypothetical protein